MRKQKLAIMLAQHAAEEGFLRWRASEGTTISTPTSSSGRRRKPSTRGFWGKADVAARHETAGGAVLSPGTDVVVFTFDGGASVAFFYVPASQALTPPQHLQAIWLEFEVDDVARTTDALARLGIEPFEYEDRTHPYFQAPGGQVFRLARRSNGGGLDR